LDQQLPGVKPNPKLREKLDSQSADELYGQLRELDPVRAATIDRHNKRRLVRALEIILTTGKPVPPLEPRPNKAQKPFNAFWIGIRFPQEELYSKIERRLKQRIKAGMAQEVETLHTIHKISWKRLEQFGLEYKFVSLYLQNKLSHEEMQQQLSFAIKHYAKRQMTWFKRNKEIHWIGNYHEAREIVEKFLK
jgi:tRNA dimethylallyltransferase